MMIYLEQMTSSVVVAQNGSSTQRLFSSRILSHNRCFRNELQDCLKTLVMVVVAMMIEEKKPRLPI